MSVHRNDYKMCKMHFCLIYSFLVLGSLLETELLFCCELLKLKKKKEKKKDPLPQTALVSIETVKTFLFNFFFFFLYRISMEF